MGEVVNLRRARKAKVRADAGARADANRAAFGRTKAARAAAVAEERLRDRTLDGAKREEGCGVDPGRER